MPGILALTGGTGFIGGHILAQALDAGWQVHALARRPEALAPREGLTVVPGSLESVGALDALLQSADAAVHAAGLVAARGRAEFERINAAATGALVEAATRRTPAPRFLLISSLAAREPELSDYCWSKAEGEARLKALGEGLDWSILRPPVVYGPGDKATLPLFRQFKRGLVVHPAGGGRFSMIHAEDLAGAVLALLEGAGAPGAVAEVDDGHPGGYAWDDVIAAAGRQFSRRIRGLALPAPILRAAALAASAYSRLRGEAPFLSQGKISEALHNDWVCRHGGSDILSQWRPKFDLDQGFAQTIAWYTARGQL